MSVDPLARKYPALSPYVYVCDNPLAFLDPSGDTINTSELSGPQLRIWNAQVAKGNKSKAFAKVYGELEKSTATYFVKVGKLENGGAGGQFVPNEEGKLHTGGTVTILPSMLGSMGAVSHELFHAYQNDLGPYVDISSGKEIEAFLFMEVVHEQLHGFYTGFPAHSAFAGPFQSLLTSGFSNKEWYKAIDTFNQSIYYKQDPSMYDRLKPVHYANPLISRFLP